MLHELPHHRLAELVENKLGNPHDNRSVMSYQRVVALDEQEAFQEEFFQFLLGLKLHHYYVPTEQGGLLDSYEQLYAIGKVLARRDLSTAVTMSTMVWSTLVWIGGTPQQKRHCAELTMSIHGAQCLAYSEEQHGSDLIANEFTAVKLDEGYRLQGEKWPINRAARSDVVMLLAKTDADAGGRGLSLFMVEKGAIDYTRITYLPKVKSLGLRGCDICGIRFDGAVVPETALIGRPGDGLELAIRAFQVTRTLCVSLSVGALENNLRVVTSFAMQRRLYRACVFDIPQARHLLVGAFVDLLLTDALGASLVRALHVVPEQFGVLSAVAKFFAPFKLDQAQRDLATVLGARYFFREKHMEGVFQKSLRDSQVVAVFDGSSEINLYSLAAQLPALARRQHRCYANACTDNADTLGRIFDAEAALPRFAGERLDISSHGKDVVMESWPLALARLAEIRRESAAVESICNLAHALYERHRAQMARLAGMKWNEIDIRSPRMFQMAKDYGVCFAGIAAVQYWLANRHAHDAFVSGGEWLALGLKSLLWALRDDTHELPDDFETRAADELARRYEQHLSFGIVPIELPDREA